MAAALATPALAAACLDYTQPTAPIEPTTLDIFDLAGRRVAQLVAGDRPAGEHRVIWKPDELPSDIYLARLGTPNLVRISKLDLLQ